MLRKNAAPERNLTLHCTICTDPIEEKRARRNTATCSEACKDRLDFIRAKQRESKRCPHCLSPSTPEEREEFRIWRSQRPKTEGDRLALKAPDKHGRDTTLEPKQKMLRVLRAGVKLAKAHRLELYTSYLISGAEQKLDNIEDERVRDDLSSIEGFLDRASKILDKAN